MVKGQTSLYEKDFYLWLEKTIESLQSGEFEQIDLNYLIAELESMGRSEKRELCSRLLVLLEHLLKLQYWEMERANSARG